ncbi:MAG: sigma-70 family RNA polymerase sigma factor [Bacteroidia bacterium]
MRQLKISKQITNRDSKAVERYLHEIAKENMINAEEEVRLAKLIKGGDENALEKLVRANLRFVVSVAKQYQNLGLSLEDLINEGNLGLIKAAIKFDETRGFKFISYAVWWIRQSILQAAAENSRIVRLPLNRVSNINKIAKASSKLEQKYEREPTNSEISEILEMNADEITDTLSYSKRHVSMDAPVSDGDDSGGLINFLENHDALNPVDKLMRQSLEAEIERALSFLDEREAEVIRLSYGLNGRTSLSLDEISLHFDLTRERIRQIKDKALKRLRGSSKTNFLRSYL